MKLKLFCIAILLFIAEVPIFAQTGSIRVTVFDQESGEAMIGANVVLAGTTTGNVTDLDGKATISGLNAGTYTINVSFVSYLNKTIEEIVVKENEITALSVQLTTEDIGLEEVVVTAKAIRSSENALMTIQKKSPKLLDAISSDQFSRLGDSDAASAVKRVVGVTVEGGKYVYVRGLGDRYSKAILNGADIPGVDPNKNAVQLDLFPSNLIDNIIVYKTFSPDLSGDFAGGLVDISTKDFPDRFTMQFSAKAQVNSQANFNNNFLTYNGGKNDWLGIDDGSRSLPDLLVGIPEDKFPSPSRIGLPGPGGSPITQNDVTLASRSFENRQFQPSTASQPVSHSFSFSLGSQKNVFNNPLGFVAGLTYSRGYSFYDAGKVNRFEGISTNQENLNRDVLFSNDDQKSQDEVSLGTVFNTAYKIGNNHKIGLNLLYNRNAQKETRFQDGYRLDNEPDSTNLNEIRVLSWIERTLANGQLHGEHNIPGLNNVKIDWLASYTNSTLDQPDLRLFSNNILLNGEDASYIVNNRNRPGRYYRDMQETNLNGKFNITIPTKIWGGREGKFKTGFAYVAKDREYREDRYEYFVNPRNYDGDVDALFADDKLGYNQNGIALTTLELFTQKPNNYDASQKVYAAYLLFESNISDKLRMTTGLRYEKTEMDLQSFDEDIFGNFKTDDYLPALSFSYAMQPETNLRFSYGRTLARPTFREFAPLATFAFPGEFDQLGNPNLTRTLIDNLDLRWETYPRRGEYLGISAFYKYFTDPIENTVNPDAGGSSREYRYENVDKGLIIGAEIEFKKSLDFISPGLENFKISTNLTYIYSEVSLEADELEAIRAFNPDAKETRDMYNQSPFVINANLLYNSEKSGLSSNVSFNVFGQRLTVFQTDLPFIYEQPRPDLNFSIKKKFGNHTSVRFRADNLLNPDYKHTIDYNGTEYIYNSFSLGRSFSLSFTYLIE